MSHLLLKILYQNPKSVFTFKFNCDRPICFIFLV